MEHIKNKCSTMNSTNYPFQLRIGSYQTTTTPFEEDANIDHMNIINVKTKLTPIARVSILSYKSHHNIDKLDSGALP